MGGAVVPAPVRVRFKFGSESSYGEASVPPPATRRSVCAAVLAARSDVRALLAGDYAGFELALADPESGRPLDPEDPEPIAPDAAVEVTLTKSYAVRAFAPVREYVVGRFLGTKPPRFRAGRAAAVDWQMRRVAPEAGASHHALSLNGGGKQRSVFTGTREGGALGNFYLLMMQANTTDVCAIPMERWYNFRPDAPRRVLSLEEAEEAMERLEQNKTSTSTWLEKHTNRAANGDGSDDGLSDDDDLTARKIRSGVESDSDADDNDYDTGREKKRKKRVKDEAEEADAKTAGGDAADAIAPGARGMTKAEGDDWEHDGGASDDEGAGEADELELEEPPPPPPAAGLADSDDEGLDAEGDELGEEGKKVRRLLGKADDEEGGGLSDDDDSDDDFVDPDQEELHPFLLRQRDAMQAQARAQAAEAKRAQSDAAEQKRQLERTRAAIGVAAGSAAGAAAAAARRAEPQTAVAGTKRARDAEASPASAAGGSRGAKMGRVGSGSEIKSEGGGGGGGGGGGDAAAVRPIEAALRDVLRRGGKPTTKDVTKALRKRGLLDTDADKSELKATIARVARIRKEGNKSFVVLQ